MRLLHFVKTATVSFAAFFVITAVEAAPPKPAAPAARTATGDNRPVTQEQFRQAILVLKRTVDRLDKVESSQAAAGGGGGGEGEVDLSKMGGGGGTSSTNVPGGKGVHGPSVAAPNFKIYFDFNLVDRPGQDNLSFKNYHTFLFFELIPKPDMQFSFDMQGYQSINYYELDLQATPRLQIRLGKIWIPFDDLSPHNIFGGRVDVSMLQTTNLNSNLFLPNIWADLGVGLKYQLLDTRYLSVETHLYIVNGFGAGGTDPTGQNPPSQYPQFNTTTSLWGAADNNRDKAIGGRVRMTFLSGLSLGASFYTGKWTGDDLPLSGRLNIFGVDGQLRLGRLELRSGLAYMLVGLPAVAPASTSFTRAGAYVEGGMKFGSKQDWKALLRTGLLQLDNRGNFSNDQDIVGGTLLYKPGLLEYSIEHSRDLLIRPGKLSYTYTAARVIIGL